MTYFALDEYISSQGVTLFMQSGKGKDVWISTSNGVLLYDGKSFQHFHSKEGLKGSLVRRTLLLQSGELLTAEPRGLNVVGIGKVSDFQYDKEIGSFPALSMAQRHDGLLALGSFEDGVVVFHKTKQNRFFTVKQGLCSNLIYNTSFDQKGRLWIGTERGIDLLTLDAQFRIASIRHFNETDGFTARETNPNTAYVSPNGDFWIGTIKGIFHYRENPTRRLPATQKFHFTEVKSPFLIPLCLLMTALAGGDIASPLHFGWANGVLGAFFSYEVSRKLDPSAHPILGTYLSVYGRGGSTLIVSVLTIVAALGAAASGFTLWMTPFAVLTLLSYSILWVKPSAFKVIEGAATLSLFFHIWAPVLRSIL